MAHQSLYRRYRPRRFDEVRGQEHVVTALRNAVANSTVGHAYLFSGPRGTGKTSTARILAKALNCENLQGGEPCGDCTPCQDMDAGRSYDIFELDAASNNSVDDVRDLVARAAVGSPGRTKVYILDEVHMLSTAASNALLKTLEEPPDHVRFVLATTDPQKVLPTIRSRTQHYDFQLLSAEELERYVRWIVADAGLDVDEPSIVWSVRQGRGSARDTLSALDQVVAAGGVVERSQPIAELFDAITSRDPGAAVSAVAGALAQGHDPRVLGKTFLDSLRDAFLLSLDVEVSHLADVDREAAARWASEAGTPLLTRAMEAVGAALVDMRNAADPRVPLEVALVRLATAGDDSVAALVERIERLENALAAGAGAPTRPTADTAADSGSTSRRTAPAEVAAADAPAVNSGAAGSATGQGENERADAATGSGGGPAAARAALARLRGTDAAATTPAHTPAAPAAPASPTAPAAPAATPAPARAPSAPAAAPAPPGAPTAPAASAAPAPPVPPTPGSSAPPVPPSEPDEPPSGRAPSQSGSPPDSGDAAPESSGTPAVEPDVMTSASSSGLPELEELRAALADVVVPQLRGVAKALYSTGEMVSVGQDAVFALAIGVPLDRAERARSEVESLLAAHFGRPVPVRLVEHDDAEALGSGPAAASGGGGASPGSGVGGSGAAQGDLSDEEHEDVSVLDVHALENADVAQSGIERLTRVFPGATLVDEDEVTR